MISLPVTRRLHPLKLPFDRRMSLKHRIVEDMKQAMREKATARLSTIRMLLAAIKQREIDERIELDDAQVLSVVEKLTKQRRESIVQFEKGGRPDLVAVEKAELELLLTYLPSQLSQAEVEAAISAALQETGAQAPSDMGRVMAVLKPRLAGRADMGKVSALIKSKLQP